MRQDGRAAPQLAPELPALAASEAPQAPSSPPPCHSTQPPAPSLGPVLLPATPLLPRLQRHWIAPEAQLLVQSARVVRSRRHGPQVTLLGRLYHLTLSYLWHGTRAAAVSGAGGLTAPPLLTNMAVLSAAAAAVLHMLPLSAAAVDGGGGSAGGFVLHDVVMSSPVPLSARLIAAGQPPVPGLRITLHRLDAPQRRRAGWGALLQWRPVDATACGAPGGAGGIGGLLVSVGDYEQLMARMAAAPKPTPTTATTHCGSLLRQGPRDMAYMVEALKGHLGAFGWAETLRRDGGAGGGGAAAGEAGWQLPAEEVRRGRGAGDGVSMGFQ